LFVETVHTVPMPSVPTPPDIPPLSALQCVLQCDAVSCSDQKSTKRTPSMKHRETPHRLSQSLTLWWSRCSVVQCGVARCSVMQCGAVWCSVARCGAVWCSVLQCGAVWCSVVQCGAERVSLTTVDTNPSLPHVT